MASKAIIEKVTNASLKERFAGPTLSIPEKTVKHFETIFSAIPEWNYKCVNAAWNLCYSTEKKKEYCRINGMTLEYFEESKECPRIYSWTAWEVFHRECVKRRNARGDDMLYGTDFLISTKHSTNGIADEYHVVGDTRENVVYANDAPVDITFMMKRLNVEEDAQLSHPVEVEAVKPKKKSSWKKKAAKPANLVIDVPEEKVDPIPAPIPIGDAIVEKTEKVAEDPELAEVIKAVKDADTREEKKDDSNFTVVNYSRKPLQEVIPPFTYAEKETFDDIESDEYAKYCSDMYKGMLAFHTKNAKNNEDSKKMLNKLTSYEGKNKFKTSLDIRVILGMLQEPYGTVYSTCLCEKFLDKENGIEYRMPLVGHDYGWFIQHGWKYEYVPHLAFCQKIKYMKEGDNNMVFRFNLETLKFSSTFIVKTTRNDDGKLSVDFNAVPKKDVIGGVKVKFDMDTAEDRKKVYDKFKAMEKEMKEKQKARAKQYAKRY